MRISTLGSFLAFVTVVSAPAAAQVVLAFDGTRCYSGANQYWLTGNGMTAPYNQLLSHGYTVQTTSLITSSALSQADIFFTGTFAIGTTLSPSELADLTGWVSGGGSLLFMGDNDTWAAIDNQMVSAFNAGSFGGTYNASGVQLTINAATHPIISGPFGTVTSIGGLNSPGKWVSTPSNVTTIASNPDGSGAMLAFTFGGGRVVFCDDTNYFEYPPAYTASHAILWDNTIDWLSNAPCTGGATSYCTAGTTTNGCVSSMSASGLPSAAASSGFTLTCANTEGQKNGLVFYGVSGPNAVSWGTGSTSTLCVKSPTQRTNAQSSGGTLNACNGTLAVDFLAFMAANPGALGQPIAAGQQYHAQAWFRDPPSTKHTALSDGLSFVMCP